ncbi:MAG: T9SS type A sorting domain-containing protein [Williamsia sp.]|nr:T9SS type A sorting domain-containing protein [Williamsia sp.]
MRTMSTLFALLSIPVCTLAQDGALDPSFGTGGKAYVTAPLLNQTLSKTVVQPDGKTVLVGRTVVDNGYTFSVARFNANGQPDSSFDGDGVVTTILEAGSRNDEAKTVAVQPDGKIIAAGRSSSNFALVRYNVNGSLDATFNGTGIVKTALPGSSDLYSLVVLSDGKILAGGTSNPGSTLSDFTLVRYNANGTPDASFDGDGILTTDVAGSSADIVYSLAVQTDGKIVAAGSSNNDMALVRYNTNGTLDNSFNGNGKLLIDFGLNEIAYSLSLQADGKLVVAGVSNSGSIFNTAVARVLTGGQLDNSFDGDGKVSTVVGESDQFYSVLVQPDAKIVASGTTYSGGSSDFVVVRYTTTGTLDNTFDGDGKLPIDMGGAEAYATIASWNGTLVAGGYTSRPGRDAELAVVRLLNPSAAPVLPIKLISFTANTTGQTVSLTWKTAGTDLHHFEIEQSGDGSNFTAVGTLAARNGADQLYNYAVTQVSSLVKYYRVKMIEKNGTYTYSATLAAKTDDSKALLFLSSNPVRSDLRLQITADANTVLSIVDSRGALIMKRQGFATGSNSVSLDVSAMAKGVYYVVVSQASGVQRKAFVKD